jgi:uncharacterized membrane protein (DUF106 family)
MFEIIATLDAWMAPLFGPLLRVSIWAIVSGALSMALYAYIAPQEKIRTLQQQQKSSRKQMLAFDGEMDEMWTLIRQNLSLSFRLLGIVIPPVMLAILPVVWLVYGLYEVYDQQVLVDFGPDWMRGFDFWYLVTLLVVSIAIKVKFKIA